MSSEDIQYILPSLDNINKKEAEKLLQRRNTNVITNYKKMWKPMPKPLNQMTREEIVNELRSFRNAWEKIQSNDFLYGVFPALMCVYRGINEAR